MVYLITTQQNHIQNIQQMIILTVVINWGDNMRVFQIQKNDVLIINGDKQYSDTVENFKLDSKLTLEGFNEVIYDNYQECNVVNKEFKKYPNNDFENYIDNVDIYIKAKSEREYVPPEEPSLDEVKETKIAEMKAERDYREVQDIEYNGNTYDYDEKSRERLSRAQQYLEDNGLESILWTCADNTFSLLSIEDFKNINTISATRSTELHEQYNKLKVYINGLSDIEQVKEVTFDMDVADIKLF